MHSIHEQWSASLLNMEKNPGNGPDLIDNKKAVEIKFKVLYPDNRYTHRHWIVLGNQLNYNKDYPEIYWGFGFYKVNKEIRDVKQSELEKITDYRELYLVNWNWIKQFKIYHHKGKTYISEWEHDILFPKFRLLPEVIKEVPVKDGKLFFTEGVNPKRFIINHLPSSNNQKHYKDIPF